MHPSATATPAAGSIPLRRVLAYRNRDVVDAFREKYDVTHREARELFEDTKKWLWLASQAQVDAIGPLRAIDEMWHTFVLFTPDYTRFCDTYFGRYIHHVPVPERELRARRRRMARNPRAEVRAIQDRLEALIEVVWTHLGRATVARWFQHYSKKYPGGDIPYRNPKEHTS